MNIDQKNKELNELSEAFASLIKPFEELKAMGPIDNEKSDPAVNSQIQSCMNAIYAVANNLHSRMDMMRADMYAYQDKHDSGHLPPCPSPEHMEKAMAALGWDKNFEVHKKHIFASKDLFEIKAPRK